jgi:hypothetical protein
VHRYLLAAALVSASIASPAAAPARSVTASASAEWTDGQVTAAQNAVVAGRVSVAGPVPAPLVIDVTLTGGAFTAIPQPCSSSSIVTTLSYISDDSHRLVCHVARAARSTTTVTFDVLVTGATGDELAGQVSTSAGQAVLPRRTIIPGTEADVRLTRLLSSPDFLNADVGDLRDGPNFWSPQRSENSVNGAYRRALGRVLGDWSHQDAEGVLVAGDLVEGWWGTDPGRTGTFGPVSTTAERRAAVRRAADTYYPQWLDRFTDHHLTVYPAMGDHEFGDNPWGPAKRVLAPQFESSYASNLLREPDGTARFTDRPRASPHAMTAYAWRPSPDVQVITLNEFDVADDQMRIRLDEAQLSWLVGVLKRARRDGVQWVVAQGHVPIVGPVRTRGSSGLVYEHGRHSDLWRAFRRYGVDLYLCGEVHDVTAIRRDRVVQLSHGGLFAFGLTNYVLLDFYDDHVSLTSRDYRARYADAPDGSRLWETRPLGMPTIISVAKAPFTIGTATLGSDGSFSTSGILDPWNGDG